MIGAHGGGIFLYLLACRGGTQVNIENPRQVPAYHYPSKYGPKSPNFARATYFAPDGPGRIFVSGTAAILGHQTMHHGDVEQQCRLALGNIAQVIGTGIRLCPPAAAMANATSLSVSNLRRRACVPPIFWIAAARMRAAPCVSRYSSTW